MSALNRDYDEVLRRALRAAADSVEPSADGLERIRARLSGPPLLSFASSSAWYSDAAVRFTTWAAPIMESATRAFWWVVDQFRPAHASSGRASSRLGWLRPVAAMGTAIFVVAAGAFAVMTLPQAISSGSSGAIFPWQNPATGSGGGSGHSGVAGTGTPLPGTASSSGPSRWPSSSSPASSRCKSPRPAKKTPVAPTPPVMSSSTTPSVPPITPSATPTVTPTLTPTPTVTPTPSDSGTPPVPGSASTPSPSTSPVITGHTSPATVHTAAAIDPLAPMLTQPRQAVMLPAKSPCPSPSARKSRAPLAAGGLDAAAITAGGGVAGRVTRGEVS